MPEDLIKQLEAGSKFLAKTCLHSKIIITVDGIQLVETKEFHPRNELLCGKELYGGIRKHYKKTPRSK